MEATDAGTISANTGMKSTAGGDISAHELAIVAADYNGTGCKSVISTTVGAG